MPLTPLGRARFRIYPQGVQAERLEYDEKMLQLSTQKQSIVKALEHFETDDACRVLTLLASARTPSEPSAS